MDWTQAEMRKIFLAIVNMYEKYRQHFIIKNFQESESSGSSYNKRAVASRGPHLWVAFSGIKMPYGTYHRRQDNEICGSEKNHSSTHQPKDEAGVCFQKNGASCLPKYLDKDRDIKIQRTVDKMNDDFTNKKKAYQCFPTKK